MLKRIRIAGLGPHLDFRAEFDPRGENNVTGPSESGKSFLVEAVVFALYGRSVGGRFRPEAVHDQGKRALVELTLDSGLTVRRTITRSRSTTRSLGPAQDDSSYSSEASFATALGKLGEDPDAVVTVLAPMHWTTLVGGNARKFRDLLARVLPSVGTEDILRSAIEEAGFTVDDADLTLTDSQASSKRRDARKRRDEASGRLQLARERLDALLDASQAAAGEDEVPEELVERVRAWEAYEEVTRGSREAAALVAAAADWDRRREALGEEPERSKVDAKAVPKAQAATQAAMQTVQQLAGQQQMYTMQRQMFGTGSDVCPTCQRPGWTTGEAMATQLDEQLAALGEQLAAANAAWQAAQATLNDAMQAATAAEGQATQHAQWKRSVAALGERPEPPEGVDLPEPPASERPSTEEMERVKGLVARAAALESLKQRQEEELAAARQEVQTETERLEGAEHDAAKWDAVLDAVRKAPSIVAAQQARALGSMGPVTLEFGENPAVTVLIDGRPWWLASRGRQVVADAFLRNALRRAVEMPHLPLFIDNVQDVGGQPLPDVPGPTIWLTTNDSAGLTVRRKTSKHDTTGVL